MKGIERIKRLKITDVWQNEAKNFTPWLCENIEILSECIGITLQNPEKEQSTGNFNVDIKAEDDAGRVVVIENQYNNSDHDHLGKLITYRTAFDAKIAIWIVETARQEHVDTINWLNEVGTGCDFYLIQISAIQIGESLPAPLLTILAQPNEQTKVIGNIKKSDSLRAQNRKMFWAELIEMCREMDLPAFQNSTPSTGSWISSGAGIGGLGYYFWVTRDGIRVSFEIDRGDESENQKIYDFFFASKDEIQKEIGKELSWQSNSEMRKKYISYSINTGGYSSADKTRKKSISEAIELMKLFISTLNRKVKKLK